MALYIFDGTLVGLLTAVFEYYERKPSFVSLIEEHNYQPSVLMEETLMITADVAKSERVWKGMTKKLDKEWQKNFYFAFLSEQAEMFQKLFDYCIYIFDNQLPVFNNYGDDCVLSIAQMAKKVSREKHRMEAFVRFKKSNNQEFFAVIQPDFNVIPIIAKHFKNRYADQPWIIYDEKRHYGIQYDLNKVNTITLMELPIERNEKSLIENDVVILDDSEQLYAQLWSDYFKATNIVERKNMKLHIQHVPKRYWKYLTEKNLNF